MLRIGKAPEAFRWWRNKRFMCSNCRVIWRMKDNDDVKHRNSAKNEELFEFACPECHRITFITEKDIIPDQVKDANGIAGRDKNGGC